MPTTETRERGDMLQIGDILDEYTSWGPITDVFFLSADHPRVRIQWNGGMQVRWLPINIEYNLTREVQP